MFTKVLVPLDQSALAEHALAPATAIAKATRGEVRLVFAVDAAPYDGALVASWGSAIEPEDGVYVRDVARKVADATGATVDGAVERGPPVDAICRHARAVGADLIVMTTHGRTGLSRAWLGSVADGVVRNASVPVLMLRPAEGAPVQPGVSPPFHRILVPHDGSAPSAAILESAAAMARCCNAALIVVQIVRPVPIHVFDAGLPSYPTSIVDPDATQLVADKARVELTALAEQMETDHAMRVETEIVMADGAAAAILQRARAKHADLIAMTTHGRGASRLIVGSVTDKVLRGSGLPLLLYHPRAVATVQERQKHRGR